MNSHLEDYIKNLHKMALDLNNNIEIVKTWMSTQHLHNELFLESINNLKERMKKIEEKQ